MLLGLILAITITITDLDERELITEKQILREIVAVADTARLQPADCQRIENRLRQHPMVREAECWMDTKGALRVRIGQRIPPVVGAVNLLAKPEQLNALSAYIHSNSFLRENVLQIEVKSAKMIVLQMKGGKVALLGPLTDNYPNQLYRLEKIYKAHADLPCREFDLRYDGQVVTR